ncbi:pyrophosphatase [Paraburkholderia caffeinilytica]|uniref:Pyrophosphatase n=1 Tax=Paraburkholderia caffeinilytica TaxID=1761016 RepID=A0ABQ1M8W9_9BURK|nr:pyrophosphatase [Paraburkholderia caffeinilytica]GGC36730.1 pyrophosphatase [Paraburkholderia caffeinilytica]CAB3791464.1 hypothetical protein LMG28690_03284 [Paraburkholderia caffeinilytica]
MILRDYFERIRPLDKLHEINAVRLGLFGEVGSVLTTAKKKSREGKLYDYETAITQELGDVIWYFFRLVDRLNLTVDVLLPDQFWDDEKSLLLATNDPFCPVAQAAVESHSDLEPVLERLGSSAATLLNRSRLDLEVIKADIQEFFASYLGTLQATGISFASVLENNLQKTEGRFLLPDFSTLPTFDEDFDDDERLPAHFEISIIERPNGKSYLKWNDVFIGDPLTDNIETEDGYKFHDVFHMAHAAILHWSPTFRALIRHKRKSNPKYDEQQDGGRAIVIEEGLTAWIFSNAKNADLFREKEKLSFDLLKGIKQFVNGYEVQKCPLSLWEKAILDGYRVFRELSQNRSGVIIGDRATRSISYRRG